MLHDKDLDQFAILMRIVEEIVCAWEQSMQESTDYTFRRNAELRILDAKKLIEVCNQYFRNNEHRKVRAIFQYYEGIIENWDELIKEQYRQEMEAYLKRLDERRKITMKQQQKENRTPEISEKAPNYHDEDKIHDIVYNKAVQNVLDTHSYLFNMVGYSMMNEGLRANLYAQGIKGDRRCLKTKVSLIADGMDCTYEEKIFRHMYMEPRADAAHVNTWLEEFPEMKPAFYQMLEMYKEIATKEKEMYEREWVFAKNMAQCVIRFKELKIGICALYLLLGIVDENKYCGNDLLVFEALENERIMQPEQNYIFSMCRGLSMKYQDYSIVANWLMSQRNQINNSEYNPKQDELRDFLMSVLLKEIYSPQVMELSLHKMLHNQIVTMQLSEIERDKVEFIPTRLSKDGIGLYFEPKKVVSKNGKILFRGDKAFLEKLSQHSIELMFAHTNEMVSGRHKWAEIFDVIKDLKQDHLIESFIQLTGYNTCMALLYGLQGICVYKDRYKEYKESLEKLFKEVGRYIKVLGPGADLIIYTMFNCIKSVNEEQNLWKFGRNNVEQGIDCINMLTETLKKCDIEMLIEYHHRLYLQQVIPNFYSKRQLFLRKDREKDLLELERDLDEASKSLELKKRIEILFSQTGRNEYFVKEDVWDELISPLTEYGVQDEKKKSHKPTTTNGRWYCFFQKMMIDVLN